MFKILKKEYFWATLTNIAFPLAGLIALFFNPFTDIVTPILSLFLLGYGSYWLHATHDRPGRFADWLGMFGTLAAFTGLFSANLFGPDIGWAMTFVMVVLPTMFYPKTRKDLYIGIAYAVMIAAAFFVIPLLPFIVSLLSFAAGFLLRTKGEKHEYHSSDYNLYHSGWHIFTANGFLFLLIGFAGA